MTIQDSGTLLSSFLRRSKIARSFWPSHHDDWSALLVFRPWRWGVGSWGSVFRCWGGLRFWWWWWLHRILRWWCVDGVVHGLGVRDGRWGHRLHRVFLWLRLCPLRWCRCNPLVILPWRGIVHEWRRRYVVCLRVGRCLLGWLLAVVGRSVWRQWGVVSFLTISTLSSSISHASLQYFYY